MQICSHFNVRTSFDVHVQTKRQVLFAMEIDAVTHVPAQDLADVMPLFANTLRHGSVKPQILGTGPGVIRLNFSKACPDIVISRPFRAVTTSCFAHRCDPHFILRVDVNTCSDAPTS